MIRRATMDDVDRLAAMGLEFIRESGRPGATYEGCRDFCADLIGGNGVAFLSEGGCIAGVVAPIYYAPEKTAAVELWWRATDGQGLALLRNFEEWAVARGASYIQGSAISGHSPKSVERVWARRGYRPDEMTFVKDI